MLTGPPKGLHFPTSPGFPYSICRGPYILFEFSPSLRTQFLSVLFSTRQFDSNHNKKYQERQRKKQHHFCRSTSDSTSLLLIPTARTIIASTIASTSNKIQFAKTALVLLCSVTLASAIPRLCAHPTPRGGASDKRQDVQSLRRGLFWFFDGCYYSCDLVTGTCY